MCFKVVKKCQSNSALKNFKKEQKEEHFWLGLDTKTTLHDLVKD